MSDLISRKAVEKIIKEFFKTKVDEIPKREKFNKLCDLCDLYLELNASLHKEIEDIPVAYDVDKVVEQLQQMKTRYFLTIANTGNETLDKIYEDVGNSIDKAIEIVKGAVKDE